MGNWHTRLNTGEHKWGRSDGEWFMDGLLLWPWSWTLWGYRSVWQTAAGPGSWCAGPPSCLLRSPTDERERKERKTWRMNRMKYTERTCVRMKRKKRWSKNSNIKRDKKRVHRKTPNWVTCIIKNMFIDKYPMIVYQLTTVMTTVMSKSLPIIKTQEVLEQYLMFNSQHQC